MLVGANESTSRRRADQLAKIELSPTLNTEYLERRSAEFVDCTSTAKALSSRAELIQLTHGSLILQGVMVGGDIEPKGKPHQLQLKKISALNTQL